MKKSRALNELRLRLPLYDNHRNVTGPTPRDTAADDVDTDDAASVVYNDVDDDLVPLYKAERAMKYIIITTATFGRRLASARIELRSPFASIEC